MKKFLSVACLATLFVGCGSEGMQLSVLAGELKAKTI